MIEFAKRLAAALIFALTFFAAAALPTAAQTPETTIQLCPEGQVYEFVFECSRETLKCHIVSEGCVPA